jgi:hypothetical protein
MEPLASMAVLLAAACLQGFTGFGYSLMSLPLLALLMPVRTAVPLLSVTSIFLNLLVFLRARRSADPRRIMPLIIAGTLSVPLGVWVLGRTDEAVLEVAIGVLVALSALLYLAGFRVRLRRERLAMVPVGILSGVLNGMTTFSGPPVILFLANQGTGKDAFRASLALYFLILNLVAVPVYAGGGFLTGDTLRTILVRFPAVAVGALAGIHLAGRVDETRFRRMSLLVLAVLGVLGALSGSGVL